MDNKNKIPIYTIYVNPRNNHYCNYIINENQSHTKKYNELETYLISLLPEKMIEISRFLELKKPFIIFLQEKEIKELLYDYDSEILEKKKALTTSNLLKEAQKEFYNNKKPDYIKYLSSKDVSKKFYKS